MRLEHRQRRRLQRRAQVHLVFVEHSGFRTLEPGLKHLPERPGLNVLPGVAKRRAWGSPQRLDRTANLRRLVRRHGTAKSGLDKRRQPRQAPRGAKASKPGEWRDAARSRHARLHEGAAERRAGMRARSLAVEPDHLGVRVAEPGRRDAAEQHRLARTRRSEHQRVADVAVVQVDVDVLAGPGPGLQERGRAFRQARRGARRAPAPDRPDRHEVRHRLCAQQGAAGVHGRVAGEGGHERRNRVHALLPQPVMPVVRGRPEQRKRRGQRGAALALQQEDGDVVAVALVAARDAGQHRIQTLGHRVAVEVASPAAFAGDVGDEIGGTLQPEALPSPHGPARRRRRHGLVPRDPREFAGQVLEALER